MTAALARLLMALAVHSLGDHRRQWALAIQVEFESAREDGKSLSFALGCLLAACRDLPAHESGRFAIASNLLAYIVIVPAAALMVASVLTGLPEAYFAHAGATGPLSADVSSGPELNEGNRFVLPSLALLLLLLAVLNLRIAWLALDRDWARVVGVAALSAATTATMIIVSAVAFFDHAAAIAHAGLLAIELAALLALGRWDTRLSRTPC